MRLEAGQSIPSFVPADDEDPESSSGSALFVDLPHLPSADVEGGQQASKTAPGVDTEEVSEVQHRPPPDLRRAADRRGRPRVARTWGRIDWEPKRCLPVLVRSRWTATGHGLIPTPTSFGT